MPRHLVLVSRIIILILCYLINTDTIRPQACGTRSMDGINSVLQIIDIGLALMITAHLLLPSLKLCQAVTNCPPRPPQTSGFPR